MTPLTGFGTAATVAALFAIALHKLWGRWSARHTFARHLPGGDPAADRHTPEGYAKTILGCGVGFATLGVMALIAGLAIR